MGQPEARPSSPGSTKRRSVQYVGEVGGKLESCRVGAFQRATTGICENGKAQYLVGRSWSCGNIRVLADPRGDLWDASRRGWSLDCTGTPGRLFLTEVGVSSRRL